MRIITSGARPICPGWSGRCSRASSVPMNRSGATIRSANISTTSPAMASSNRSMCRPTGRRSSSRTRRPGCSAPPRKPAGRMRSSPTRISARTTCARSSTGSSATRWCAACACNCTGTRTRSIASPRAPICARTRRSAATSRGWPTMTGASICRCSRRRCRTRPALPKPVRTSPSCCSTPACWRTCRLPAARPGAPAWCGWRRVRTSSASSPGSAPSFIATTLRISPLSSPSTVAIFGADRCLFGSNFPIEKLWTSYRDLVEAYLDAIKSNPRHRDAILRDTAMRVYRLAP